MYLQKYTFLIINFLAALLFCTNVNAQITVDGNTNDWASALNSQPLKAFVRDANDTNDDSFTQGSSDIGLISSWKWSNGQTNNKGDISNAAAVMIGNKIYFAGDRTAINGSAQIGFWFFKKGVAKGTEPDFVGVHEIGDLLVLSNFTNGGGVSELRIYRWVGSGGSDNQLDLIATTFDGFVNQTYQPTPVYPSWTYQGNNVPSVGVPPPNVYATGSFFEGSIDLSLFGLDPCFSSFLLETRNSPSVTAALQDFAGGKFNSMPDPPTVTNAERCGPGAVTLSANCTTGNGVRWYTAASGGNPLTAADGVSANGTSLTVNIISNVTYYVACVRSGGQCESERVPVTGTIKSPPTVTLSGGPILCHGGTATITATVAGGSGNYSYAWMKDNSPFNNPGGGNIIQNAGPGMYSVVITDTTQGCTSAQSNSVTLADPAEIILNIASGSILCHGGMVTLTANASGGSGSYTYLWSNGATTQSIQAGAGSYSVSVTDANSCSKSASTTLAEPEQLVVNIGNTPILCHGGMSTLTANASGGTGSYTYLWSNGATTQSIQVIAGSYSVSVTDANSCSAPASVTVSEPEQLAVNIGNTPILCHGGMSTLTANASGGTGSYTYLWSNGATTQSIQVGAGSYSVSVTDTNSCSAPASITVSEPEQLAVNIGSTPILCNGGTSTLTANASGGTGSYSYLWSNGATTQSIQVSGGSYSVSVTDANSCSAPASVTISEPERLIVNIGSTPILCNGGTSTLTANASGGTGSYSYLWSNGATTQSIQVGAGSYSVSVTDANSCSAPASITVSEPEKLAVNIGSTSILCHGGMSTLTANVSGGTGSYSYLWSNGATTQSIQVSGGSYSVSVTDANSCNASASVTVSEPEQLAVNIGSTPILCHGGMSTLTANVSGGTGSYSYLWSNGATTQSIQVSGGSYSVSVTDANSCSAPASITVSEPEQLAVNIGNTPILCHGEMSTLTANASGGTGSYTYLWSNGATTQSIQVGAGSYSVSVTDANSCSAPASVTVSEPEQLAVNIGSTPIICYGGMSTLTANASGGTGSYSYLWSNGATTQSIQVSGGSYSVKVTDQNSCSAQASITVVAPSPLTLTINKGDVICLGGTATVSANVTGGMPPYSYLWSNGATTQTVNLPIGNFSVIVTDSNGCTISKDFEVKMLACSGFTTVTQGGWGAKAAGNNWGKYRDNNFASAFPTGLTIGAGSRFLKLTTAKAVDDFLPSGTTPRALNAGTMINPGSSYSNVLAGQVVALTLSLRFDQVNPSFSSSATWLGDLIVVSGTFAGWTVNQVLAEANNVLGGVASSYSADQMNAIVDAINNNYDGGTVNLGLLGCPCSSNVKPLAKDSTGNGEVMTKNPNASVNDDSKVYPNPTRGDINLSFENADGGNVSAYLFNSSGRMVADLSKNVSRHGNRVTISYQNYSLLEGIYILSVKASKFEKSYKIMIRK